MEQFIYNNPKLRGRCIAFAYGGSVYLKQLFKDNNMSCKVQVKRHLINEDDDNYSPYHYYIEVKTPKGKMIIDNCNSYNYWYYRDKFRPKKIEKIIQRNIDKEVKLQTTDVDAIVKQTILYHFKTIQKYY